MDETSKDNSIQERPKSKTDDKKKTTKRKQKKGKSKVKEELNYQESESDMKHDIEDGANNTNSYPFLNNQLEDLYFKKSLLNDILNEKKRVRYYFNCFVFYN